MDKNAKIFFIDLDGTTLDIKKDGRKWVSNENLEAIREMRKLKNQIIISTGRIEISAQKYIDLFGGEYTILVNGAQIIDKNGKKIVDLFLSIQQIFKIVKIAKKYKMCFKHSDSYEIYGVQKFFWKYIAKKLGFKYKSNYLFEMHKKRHKVILWGKISRKKINKIKDEINRVVQGVIAVTSSEGFSIEITNIDATKGKAAEKVSKLLRIDKSKTIHIGDSMNDSTALDYVGKLIAMKNSQKDLKKITSYIGPNYKKGGLAKILRGLHTQKII